MKTYRKELFLFVSLLILTTGVLAQKGWGKRSNLYGPKERLNMLEFNGFDLHYGNLTLSYERLTRRKDEEAKHWGIRVNYSHGLVNTYNGSTYSGLPRSESKLCSFGMDLNAYFISTDHILIYFGGGVEYGLFEFNDFEVSRVRVSEPEVLHIRYASLIYNFGLIYKLDVFYFRLVGGLGFLKDEEEDWAQYGYGSSGDYYKGKYDDKGIYNIEVNVGIRF